MKKITFYWGAQHQIVIQVTGFDFADFSIKTLQIRRAPYSPVIFEFSTAKTDEFELIESAPGTFQATVLGTMSDSIPSDGGTYYAQLAVYNNSNDHTPFEPFQIVVLPAYNRQLTRVTTGDTASANVSTILIAYISAAVQTVTIVSAILNQIAIEASNTAVAASGEAEAARIAAQGFRDEAEDFATSADVDAATAATQAGIATSAASTATTQAGIATTKAGESLTSANNAATSEATTEDYRDEVIAAYNNLTTQGSFKGAWNASTNSPALTPTPSVANDYYEVTTSGTQSITGSSTAFVPGDRVRSNGTAWVRVPFAIADNSLVSSKLQDGAVTESKTTFFGLGKNLFNSATGKDDYYLNEFNVELSNASYGYSDFIKVTPGLTYTGWSGSNGMRFTTYFNSAKLFVSGGAGGPVTTFTVPAGVEYVRVTYIKANKSTFQFEQSASSTSYAAYKNSLLSSSLPEIVASNLGTASVTSAKIQDGAVTAAKTDFIATGKNKANINASDTLLGQYVEFNSSTPMVNAAYNLTGYVKLLPSTTYYPSVKNRLIYLTSTGVYISGELHTRTNQYFTTPAAGDGAGFIYARFSVPLANWSTFQVELGTSGTAWEAYYEGLKPQLFGIKTITTENIASGNITTDLLADKSVTDNKLGILELGKNLFNPDSTVTTNDRYVLSTDGTLQVNTAYVASAMISVSPSTLYSRSHKYQGAWFTSSGAWIEGFNNAEDFSMTSPSNAAFVRLSVAKTAVNSFQWEAGSPTGYLRYGYFLKSNYINTSTTNASTTNELAVAPKYYIPRGRELVLYFENITKDNLSPARTQLTSFTTLFGRGGKIQPANLTPVAATAAVYDRDFSLVATKNISIVPVDETKTTALKILLIGDSFTLRSTYVNKLMASSAATGIAFYGIRNSAASTPTVLCEGRGGWMLVGGNGYTLHRTDLFNPFMQPQSPYRYWGNTSFWISAKGTTNYDTAGFSAATLALYNATTGYLNSPATNDVIYDNALSAYKVYNGSAWVTVTGLTWTFQFDKYRAMWGIPALDAVPILLGTNDFAGTTPANFDALYTNFKAAYDVVIASIRADLPSCKIIVSTPASPGKIGDDGIYDTEMKKLTLWKLANKLIADYGNREGEGILLLDYHGAVDRVFGYDKTDILPFSNYTGTARDKHTLDTVHWGADGFAQAGELFYGIIQSIR